MSIICIVLTSQMFSINYLDLINELCKFALNLDEDDIVKYKRRSLPPLPLTQTDLKCPQTVGLRITVKQLNDSYVFKVTKTNDWSARRKLNNEDQDELSGLWFRKTNKICPQSDLKSN